jgi:hypothetical protein
MLSRNASQMVDGHNGTATFSALHRLNHQRPVCQCPVVGAPAHSVMMHSMLH